MSELIHIHAPQSVNRTARREVCPCCNKRSVLLAWFYEWYGASVVCLRCGDRWADGERLPRPFARGWRKDSIESARKLWKKQSTRTHDTGGSHE